MDRREFVKGCVAGAGLLGGGAHVAAGGPSGSPRVALVMPDGTPLRASALPPHEAHCFFYPYTATPCLLLDVGTPVAPSEPAAGDPRPGGVGPGRSIVAYTGICSHEWSHPDPEFSPIHYVPPGGRAILVGDRDRLIVCCSHASAFDPAAGGRVVQSPARLPLASVVLEWDERSDALVAADFRGPDSFDRFFAAFDRERRLVAGAARVVPLRVYSRLVGRC